MKFRFSARSAISAVLLLALSPIAAAEKWPDYNTDQTRYVDHVDRGEVAIKRAGNSSFLGGDLPKEAGDKVGRWQEVRVVGVVQAGDPNLKTAEAVFRSKNGYKYALLKNESGRYVAVLIKRFEFWRPNFYVPYFKDPYFYRPELGWGAPSTWSGYQKYYESPKEDPSRLNYVDHVDRGEVAITRAGNRSFRVGDLPKDLPKEVSDKISRWGGVDVIGVVQAGDPNLNTAVTVFRSKNGYKYALLKNEKGGYVAVLVKRFEFWRPNFPAPYFKDPYFYRPELGWGAPSSWSGYRQYYGEGAQGKNCAAKFAAAGKHGNQ